jgi:hypothetical protein
VPANTLALAAITAAQLSDALGAGAYKAPAAHQTGIYVNAALAAVWVDLTSVDFLSMGAAGALGPVPCDANVDFT